MTVLLLSIRPQAAQQILQGSKSYEYRRCCHSKTVTTLLLYVTAPVQRVVASVEVLSCLQGTPEQLWQQTAAGAGATKEQVLCYLQGCTRACVLELGAVHRFALPKTLEAYGVRQAPRSFVYLPEDV